VVGSVILGGAGVPTWMAAKNDERLARTGARAAPPYEATVKPLGSPLPPGMTVPVPVDPQDPASGLLELG